MPAVSIFGHVCDLVWSTEHVLVFVRRLRVRGARQESSHPLEILHVHSARLANSHRQLASQHAMIADLAVFSPRLVHLRVCFVLRALEFRAQVKQAVRFVLL